MKTKIGNVMIAVTVAFASFVFVAAALVLATTPVRMRSLRNEAVTESTTMMLYVSKNTMDRAKITRAGMMMKDK